MVDVVSGEQADDGLYIPAIERIEAGLNKSGLLFVGDCKMSAFEIRLHLVGSHHHYLSPLPLTGTTAEEMGDWITGALIRDQKGRLELVFKNNTKGEAVLIGGGYEFECLQAGRFGEQRAQRLIERVRYQITAVVRIETAIDKAKEGFGWKAFVTRNP